jgi:hypothetical protein
MGMNNRLLTGYSTNRKRIIKAKVDIGQEQGGRAEKKNSNLVPNSIVFLLAAFLFLLYWKIDIHLSQYIFHRHSSQIDPNMDKNSLY